MSNVTRAESVKGRYKELKPVCEAELLHYLDGWTVAHKL
jgi:hypothetical protein